MGFVVAIDVDGVLNNLMENWLRAYNERTGDDLTVDRVVSWDTHLYARYGQAVYDYLTADVVRACEPTEFSVQATQEMAKRHELVLVTGIWPGTYDAKIEWLRVHFPHIKNIVATTQKQYVRCDVLIDDAVHNLKDTWASFALCYDQPWNRMGWTGERVYNWAFVPDIVDRWEKELERLY